MATDVERLVVHLEAQTKQYERALARAQNTTVSALRKIDRDMAASARRQQTTWGRYATGIEQTMKRVGLALGATAGLAGLSQLGRSARGAIGELASLAETADKVGLTVEQLQELRFAAEQSGVATDTLDMAMQRFARRVGEAVQGKGELVDTLRQYNIALTTSEGRTRPLVDILKDYADAIQGADSQQERLRIAFKGFDSEGAALVNTMAEGAEGLDRYAEQARKVGIVTGEAAERARELDKRFNAVATTLDTTWKTAVVNIASGLDIVLDKFRALDERTMILPLQQKLDALALESQAIKESMATHEEILKFDPGDGAAAQALEAHQRRLDDILSQYEAIVARIAELRSRLNSASAALPTGGGGGDVGGSGGNGRFQSQGFNVPGASGAVVPVSVTRPVMLGRP